MQTPFGRSAPLVLGTLWILIPGLCKTTRCLASDPLPAAVCQESSELGFVSEIHGRWIDRKHNRTGNQPLHISSLICEDSELVQQPPFSSNDEIAIRLRDGKEQLYSCKAATVCPGPFSLPKLSKPESGFLQSLLLLLNRQPPPAKGLFARGGALSDSVVMLQSGRVSLGPALRYASRGLYLVRICQIDTKDDSPCKSDLFEQKMSVNGTLTEPVVATSLSSGLYRMELVDAAATDDQRSEAWIVVASEKDFARLQKKFEEAQAETEQWDMPSADSSSLLRLYMVGLAGEIGR